MKSLSLAACILGSVTTFSVAEAAAPNYPAAARSLDGLIAEKYAYLDKLPGGAVPISRQLEAERDRVVDGSSLLHYAEDRMASLADHHAITGSSFKDSWAVVPSFADLWIVENDGVYTIDAVRDQSPAEAAGLKKGDRLVSVNGIGIGQAVAKFWHDLGLQVTPRRAGYAARTLAAGRRDRPRDLGIAAPNGVVRQVTLASLYKDGDDRVPPVSIENSSNPVVIKINNSLGDGETVAAFDKLMSRVPPDENIVLDLRDTPSGGDTTVARGIMGWFVSHASDYQIHNRPEEERATGIPHQWVEQVLPRPGKYHPHLPVILVGRWTGSMGEGIAIGFSAFGSRVQGDPMAGLNGSVEDVALGDTGVVVKLPTERLLTVSGLPREDFKPTRR